MLRYEPLEDRSLLDHLFVITHGFQPSRNQVPDWTQDMAAAISRRTRPGRVGEAIRALIQANDAPSNTPNSGSSIGSDLGLGSK